MLDLPPAALALLDHPEDACRWPIGEQWCTREAMGCGPYCEAHKRLSIEPDHPGYSPIIVSRMLRQIAGRLGDRQRRKAA